MLIAIGHGADTAMYFQWRKSRGAFEKTHGAVVDHEGSERPRVFQEVAALGAELRKLDDVVGTTLRWRSPSSTTGRCAGRRPHDRAAARPAEDALHDGLVLGLVRELGLSRHLDVDLPEGVTVQKRTGGGKTFPSSTTARTRRRPSTSVRSASWTSRTGPF